MHKNKAGLLGETYAARYLREHGCTILAANFATRWGEIDIIGTDADCVFFAEVKTRGENPLATAAESVGPAKQKRICAAAAAFLQRRDLGLQPRFDVIEVYLDKEYNLLKINRIVNAFESTF